LLCLRIYNQTVCEKVANSTGFVYGPRIRVHGRVQAVFTAVCGHSTRAVRAVYTAQYTGVYTAVYTGRVSGRIRAVYTGRHGHLDGRVCIRPLHMAVYLYGRVHGLYTAVYTVVYTCTWPLHGRVHGPSRPVYTAVYTTVYTAVYGPCTLNDN